MRTPLIERTKPHLLKGIDTADSLGASAAKISLGHGESITCSFESGKLKRAGSREDASYTVTVVVNGKRGVTSGNRLQDIEVMVRRAVDLAQAGSVAHFDAYPAPAEYTRIRQHSERTLGLNRATMIDTCRGMVDALREWDRDLDISASAGRSEREVVMATSGGLMYENRRTGWHLGAGIQRTQGTDMLFSHAGRSWNDLNEYFDPAYITGKIGEDLRHARRTVPAPKGDVPIYLPPQAFGMVSSQLFNGLNGRNVARGISPLKDQLGEQAFSADLTILDEPHRDFSPGAAEIDSSGIPTQTCTIVEKGLIKMFLYDLDSAKLANSQPTGHSGCSPYAPVILPGDTPSEKLLADIEDGLYIKSLIGFGQSNIANGDFSCNVALGFRIENGEITGRVKNTMVAGNLYDVFRQPIKISADIDPLSLLPHAVVHGISVQSTSD